jgi:hypothetical protein
MKPLFVKLLRFLTDTPEVIPVLVERGSVRGLMTREEVQRMRRKWTETLQGRAEDPCVKAVLELLEYRIMNATAAVQYIANHQAGPGVVSYRAGEAAGLQDLMADVVKALKGEVPGEQQ